MKRYLDETLRFEVDENYPNKVIDYYSLSLKEIESILQIRPVNKKRIENDKLIQFNTVDTWFEVKGELDYLKNLEDYHRSISIMGYEIIDGHFIRIYYKQNISFS
ncbi:hypothetical protein [Heyndrickxia camelliae]|uniref:Uncharacterized protein n=1 Tax=Heyndrickxia camelliae TaxID=1707093 RepID=A0A2N3LEN0_9BACI|nr:hypothetical protein [Heyndrickxia camelliae]PKR83017.1 hypothetical protein CWO92_20985 [Heyndrickxia camelliae]